MRIVAGKAVFEQVRPSLFPGGLSASGYGTRSAPLPSNAIRRGAGSIAPFIYSPCTGRFGGQRPGEGLASGPPGMGETAERIWNSRQRRTRRNSGNSHTGCTLNENGKLRRARDCPPYPRLDVVAHSGWTIRRKTAGSSVLADFSIHGADGPSPPVGRIARAEKYPALAGFVSGGRAASPLPAIDSLYDSAKTDSQTSEQFPLRMRAVASSGQRRIPYWEG